MSASCLLVLVLTGCGSSESGAVPGPATRTASNGDVYNEVDVTFAQEMIPHHAQAVELADMVRGRDVSPEVKDLAAQILEIRTVQIEAMTSWLNAWREEVPATIRDHANAEGDGEGGDLGEDIPGMMTREEIEALASAPPAEFQASWLVAMTDLTRGAVELAKTTRQDGKFGEAVALAKDIETTQTEQVAQMEAMLAS